MYDVSVFSNQYYHVDVMYLYYKDSKVGVSVRVSICLSVRPDLLPLFMGRF